MGNPMPDRPVGEVFELKGERLEVVPDPQGTGTYRCESCALMATPSRKLCLYDSIREVVGSCNRWRRRDGRDVQFVKVENN